MRRQRHRHVRIRACVSRTPRRRAGRGGVRPRGCRYAPSRSRRSVSIVMSRTFAPALALGCSGAGGVAGPEQLQKRRQNAAIPAPAPAARPGPPPCSRIAVRTHVAVDHPGEGAAADGAERLVAGEHDAVGLRAGSSRAPRSSRLRTRRPCRRTVRRRDSVVSSLASSRNSASISASGRFAARISRAASAGSPSCSARTPPSATASAAACPASTRSFHLSVAGSSSAVTFGSHGSTRSAAGRYATSTCSTRRRAPAK